MHAKHFNVQKYAIQCDVFLFCRFEQEVLGAPVAPVVEAVPVALAVPTAVAPAPVIRPIIATNTYQQVRTLSENMLLEIWGTCWTVFKLLVI